MSVKVCFVSSRTGWIKNEHAVVMDKSNALFIAQLQRHYPAMSLAIIDARKSDPAFDYTLVMNRVYAMPLPFSYVGGFLNTWRFIRILKQLAASHEVLLVQLPFIGFISLLFVRRPTVYHLCANVLTAAANPVKYKGISRLFSLSFARLIHGVYGNLFRRSHVRVITNGTELAALYAAYKATPVVSSSLMKEDIIGVHELHQQEQSLVKLLFVGRPSLEKGLDVLIEALGTMSIDFKLTVVGFTIQEFENLLPQAFENSRKYQNKIEFKGYKSWGSGLKEIIRGHDIAIVPSRSEGTPRVILEFMSQGVCVVASRLGGIPSIIQDGQNGVLVTPGDPFALAGEIMSLASNAEWRKKLILHGIQTAHRHTVDEFVKPFIHAVEHLRNE